MIEQVLPEIVAGLLVTLGAWTVIQGLTAGRKLAGLEERVTAITDSMRRLDEHESAARGALSATVQGHAALLGEHNVALAELRGRRAAEPQ